MKLLCLLPYWLLILIFCLQWTFWEMCCMNSRKFIEKQFPESNFNSILDESDHRRYWAFYCEFQFLSRHQWVSISCDSPSVFIISSSNWILNVGYTIKAALSNAGNSSPRSSLTHISLLLLLLLLNPSVCVWAKCGSLGSFLTSGTTLIIDNLWK